MTAKERVEIREVLRPLFLDNGDGWDEAVDRLHALIGEERPYRKLLGGPALTLQEFARLPVTVIELDAQEREP